MGYTPHLVLDQLDLLRSGVGGERQHGGLGERGPLVLEVRLVRGGDRGAAGKRASSVSTGVRRRIARLGLQVDVVPTAASVAAPRWLEKCTRGGMGSSG